MRQYYYSYNEEQFGPFTLEELKPKRLKKSTLVWTEGLTEWKIADKVEELKEILVSEPPPLPKKEPTKLIETITIKQPTVLVGNTKYDQTYKKETDLTFTGIFVLVVSFVFWLASKSDYIFSYEGFISFILVELVVRISIIIAVVNTAKRQNRNPIGWGLFAFFSPGIALIIIGQLRKLRLKMEIDGKLPVIEQISILVAIARGFYSDKRFSECIEVLNKVLELDTQNSNALLLRGTSLYQTQDYEKAQKDFEILKRDEQFPEKVNYYLGIIECCKYNYAKAIELWRIAENNGNKETRILLDRYCNFKGKYLLTRNEISKKLEIITTDNSIDFGKGKYLGGICEIGEIGKFKTQISANEFGMKIRLSKSFKTYYIGISYLEIDDIVYNSDDYNFVIHLFDKSVATFGYNATKDPSKGLARFCAIMEEKTGLKPTAATNLA